MARRSRGWTTLGVLLAASLAVASSAEASKDTKAGKDPKATKGKPAAHEAGGPPGHAPAAPADPGVHSPQRAEFRGAVAELGERHAQGKLKKQELKQELAALKESRSERGRQHRANLKERWGDGLAQPVAREELRHHERRMARLERMLLLAQTERTGAAKEKLVPRIEKLIAHENERHEHKMNQLQTQAAKPAPDQAAPGGAAEKETPPKQAAAAPAADKAEKGAAP